MLQFVVVLFAATFSFFSGFAQETSSTSNSPGGDHTIYQIYVGTMITEEDLSQFNDLKELGFVRPFSISELPEVEGVSRDGSGRKVFVGPYLGRSTAEQILTMVWEKGYTDAYIEADEKTLRTDIGQELVYTVQLGAFSKPSMDQYTRIANVLAHGTYMVYEDGYYKVLSGMYPPDFENYIRTKVIPYLKSTGFTGFLRTFREPYQ